jgi:hypothetical protein
MISSTFPISPGFASQFSSFLFSLLLFSYLLVDEVHRLGLLPFRLPIGADGVQGCQGELPGEAEEICEEWEGIYV